MLEATTAEILPGSWSDLILTLTQSHKQHVMQSFPAAADKTYTLKEYVEDDEQVLKRCSGGTTSAVCRTLS